MARIPEADLDAACRVPGGLRELAGARILISGATGLVGSALTRALLRASETQGLGIKLVLAVRSPAKAKALFGGAAELLPGDIREPPALSGPLDYIVGCAGITASAQIAAQPAEALLVSVLGAKNLLGLAREKAVKSMVFLSSMEIYGTNASDPGWPGSGQPGTDQSGTGGGTAEDALGYLDLASPRAAYPEGKRAAECLCCAFHAEYGVPVKIARLAQTFGAGAPQDDPRVFAQFGRSILAGRDIVLHTDGSSQGNYCALSDAVRGILLILLRGENGAAYNVANEALHMTVRQMAERAASLAEGGRVRVAVSLPENPAALGYAPKTRLFLSSAKLRALGWEPRVGSMEELYRGMLAAWREEA